MGSLTILAYVIVVVPKTWASPRFLAESVPESMISTFSLNLFCTLLSSCRPRVLFTRRRRSSSSTTTTAAAAMAGARLPSHGSHRLGVGGARTQASICAGRDTPDGDLGDSNPPPECVEQPNTADPSEEAMLPNCGAIKRPRLASLPRPTERW